MIKNYIINQRLKDFLLYCIFTAIIFYILINVGVPYFPQGINKSFLILSKKILNIWFVLLIFLVALFPRFNIFKKKFQFRELEYQVKSDFFLVLIPMSAITQYIISNQDILTINNSFKLFFVCLLASIFFVNALPTIFSMIIPRPFLVSLSLTFISLVFYMPVLALENSWHGVGSFKIQSLLFLALFFTSLVLLIKSEKSLKIIATIFFISNTISNFTSSVSQKNINFTNNPFVQQSKETPLKMKPDIYLLTFDGYVVNETMKKYGIDNSEQEKFLRELGFKVYPKTYSIAGATLSTMFRVLDASPQFRMKGAVFAGNSRVHEFLRDQGYKLGGVHNSPSYWQNSKPNLNFYYPRLENNSSGYDILLNSILEGEFRFDAPRSYSSITYDEFLKKKHHFIREVKGPKFLYTHTGPDHSQNSGKCLPNETDLFKKRLIKANEEMKKDLELILKTNPEALIIINGDHGPYLTGNCTWLKMPSSKVTRLDLQDRYGTFLAIRWPKSLDGNDKKITVIQELFPNIFSELMGNNTLIEKIKIPSTTVEDFRTSEIGVKNGIIQGGVDKGKPLFLGL